MAIILDFNAAKSRKLSMRLAAKLEEANETERMLFEPLLSGFLEFQHSNKGEANEQKKPEPSDNKS